jgi:hypothetical protein
VLREREGKKKRERKRERERERYAAKHGNWEARKWQKSVEGGAASSNEFAGKYRT